MSFWEKAGKAALSAGKAIGEEAVRQGKEIKELKEKCESRSDRELERVLQNDGFFGASDKEKNMAGAELKRRGYSPDEIRRLRK
ncbi:hypothetical protein [uncultured Photobacterium sp.]|uniref:hypothetical protein n=1 Tax=uncultured Photobacterium sp. TaxID=173973 RepID=UPI00262A3ADB|nr:hypothetical protein [uncultured Photobacterium sp.]